MNSQRRESSTQRFGNVPAGRLNNSVSSFISKLQENNGAVESVYCDVAGNVFITQRTPTDPTILTYHSTSEDAFR